MPFIREGSSVFSMLFDASGAGTRQSNPCDDMKGVGLGCRVSKACGWLRMCRPLQAWMDSRTSGNTRRFDYLEERFMRVAHHVALLCSGSSGSRLVLSWGWIIIIRLLVPYTMFLAEYEANRALLDRRHDSPHHPQKSRSQQTSHLVRLP